jgi:hypothetical protein
MAQSLDTHTQQLPWRLVMIISTIEKEQTVFENIHVSLEEDTANIFLNETHIMFKRATFERLLFTMQTALVEEELKQQSKFGEY